MPSANGHRRRRGVKKRTVEQRVNAKRATAHKHIPDRGEVDPHDGSTWAGIGKMKLKFRDLDNDNFGTDAVDGRTIKANELDTGHYKNVSVTDAKIAGMDAGKLLGDIPSSKLPPNTIVGRANSQTQIDWRNRSVPDGALSKDYAPADSVQALKQQVSGFQNQIQNLKQQIKQLQQGKKKK